MTDSSSLIPLLHGSTCAPSGIPSSLRRAFGLFVAAMLAILCRGVDAGAQETYKSEAVELSASSDQLNPAVVQQLNPKGWRVLDDGGRAVCEVWLTKQWRAEAGFTPTIQRQYALEPGSLVGVLRLPRRGTDIRGQQIPRGLYTLRYAMIPVDGNHEGASPTRDFLAWIKAADDEGAATVDVEPLRELSIAASGTAHPAVWHIVKQSEEAEAGTVRKFGDKGWWTLRVVGQLDGKQVPMDIVVVGQAEQ